MSDDEEKLPGSTPDPTTDGAEGVDELFELPADFDAREAEDGAAMKDLWKRAGMDVAPPASNLLPSIQKRIRRRSKGKFFSDGWSTQNGKVHYVVVALVMLVVLAGTYVVLGPTGISN